MSRWARLSMVCGCAALSAVALLARPGPACADVSWAFTETSLTYALSGDPVPGFVPGVVGGLTVSNRDFLNGGVAYSFSQPIPGDFDTSGATDFLFLGGSQLLLPIGIPDCLIGDRDASINLTFDSAGNISGSVQETLELADLQMNITGSVVANGDGTVATDDSDLQCPDSQCDFTGFWTLLTALPVPEPSSLVPLTIALSLIGLLRMGAIRRR